MRRARIWLVSAAAALGVATTAALGTWQLRRAHEKEALAAAVQAHRDSAPISAQALLGGDRRALLHRPVHLRGRWVAEHTVFLEHRQMDGKVGFFVATPLRVAGTDAAVLVQRGWAPRNFSDRAKLPQVDTPAGEVELTGRIAPPPAKLYQFGSAGSGTLRQNLDLVPFAAETRLPLVTDVSVQQTGPASEGLLRDWPVAGGRGAQTNYGYAFQWWALSALIAILYAWFQFIQPRRRTRSA